jgi:cell wall-associated NlpC family hydrolase
MLCANGAHNNQNLLGAIWSYNHATWYVDQVLAQAHNYATAAASTVNTPNTSAQRAIDFALAQLGQPYVWGGNGAELTELPNGQTKVTGGFDCSGLTKASYAPRDDRRTYFRQTRRHPSHPLPRG